jgi:hypothetical protein
MKQILEEEEKPFTSFLDIGPELYCINGGWWAGEVESTSPHRAVPPPPPPSPLRVAKVGRNHLKEEIIHLLLTGIGEIYS